MIDEILCRRAKDDFSSAYQPEQAITGKLHLNPDAPDLAVIFQHWHASAQELKWLHNRLARQNSVLHFYTHERILEPDIASVPRSFDLVAERIAGEVDQLQEEVGYESIHFIGLSLGNVALAKTTSLYPDFDTATLVTASSSLADSMWMGARTQNLRQAFEEQGVSRDELSSAWADLAPASHAQTFKDKDVSVVISKRDKIIRSDHQADMLEQLRMAGARVKATYSWMGHAATLTRFCIKG